MRHHILAGIMLLAIFMLAACVEGPVDPSEGIERGMPFPKRYAIPG